MDATTRWETEAIRASHAKRSSPPRPTAKRNDGMALAGQFVTLKEAEQATGIPANTLRKWVRRGAVESYLESDGELALRMIDLGSIRARADALGRKLRPDGKEAPEHPAHPETRDPHIDADDGSSGEARQPETPTMPEGSMLVPIDAWNKMLNQLGNLHEAGQQLADARERAAKAETEAAFLRERLAELRRAAVVEASEPTTPREEPEVVADPGPVSETPDTTTYWRYLTAGWRNRKR
ncbi:MAG: hypothetical protein R2823_06010 [Acidimicrobiia bacterium]